MSNNNFMISYKDYIQKDDSVSVSSFAEIRFLIGRCRCRVTLVTRNRRVEREEFIDEGTTQNTVIWGLSFLSTLRNQFLGREQDADWPMSSLPEDFGPLPQSG
jgi:hypothetical protein